VAAFLLRRLLLGVVVLVAVSFGSFWFFARNFYIAPETMLPVPPARAWWNWFKGIPNGSIGRGVYGQDLWERTAPAIGHTALLLLFAILIVIVLSLAIGVVSATRAGGWADAGLRLVTYASWGVPAFLLALVLQKLVLLSYRHVGSVYLPVRGWPGECFAPETCRVHGLAYLSQLPKYLLLPSIALATSFVGMHARYVRSSLLVALGTPYVTTARAKGLPERTVILRHALRTSVVTFASALLLDFGSIFGAAMAVDWVFGLGGIGSLFVQTIAGETLDPAAVQLILVVTAGLVLLTSLLADLTVAWLDPRVRLR
jgi:peptide/nickel transport system permease protein